MINFPRRLIVLLYEDFALKTRLLFLQLYDLGGEIAKSVKLSLICSICLSIRFSLKKFVRISGLGSMKLRARKGKLAVWGVELEIWRNGRLFFVNLLILPGRKGWLLGGNLVLVENSLRLLQLFVVQIGSKWVKLGKIFVVFHEGEGLILIIARLKLLRKLYFVRLRIRD